MVFVIAMLALIGIEIFILTAVSNTLVFEANQSYLDASQNNLLASAYAWAQKNALALPDKNLNTAIQLNSDNMDAPHSTLTIVVSTPRNNQARVQINTSSTKARLTLKASKIYRVPLS